MVSLEDELQGKYDNLQERYDELESSAAQSNEAATETEMKLLDNIAKFEQQAKEMQNEFQLQLKNMVFKASSFNS